MNMNSGKIRKYHTLNTSSMEQGESNHDCINQSYPRILITSSSHDSESSSSLLYNYHDDIDDDLIGESFHHPANTDKPTMKGEIIMTPTDTMPLTTRMTIPLSDGKEDEANKIIYNENTDCSMITDCSDADVVDPLIGYIIRILPNDDDYLQYSNHNRSDDESFEDLRQQETTKTVSLPTSPSPPPPQTTIVTTSFEPGEELLDEIDSRPTKRSSSVSNLLDDITMEEDCSFNYSRSTMKSSFSLLLVSADDENDNDSKITPTRTRHNIIANSDDDINPMLLQEESNGSFVLKKTPLCRNTTQKLQPQHALAQSPNNFMMETNDDHHHHHHSPIVKPLIENKSRISLLRQKLRTLASAQSLHSLSEQSNIDTISFNSSNHSSTISTRNCNNNKQSNTDDNNKSMASFLPQPPSPIQQFHKRVSTQGSSSTMATMMTMTTLHTETSTYTPPTASNNTNDNNLPSHHKNKRISFLKQKLNRMKEEHSGRRRSSEWYSRLSRNSNHQFSHRSIPIPKDDIEDTPRYLDSIIVPRNLNNSLLQS